MKIRQAIAIKIYVAALLLSGCAGVQTGNDPVVVNAEKGTKIAVETIDTFLKLEYDNRQLIQAKVPVIHVYANYVRLNAPKWISTARELTKAYKNNRTPENRANLETALAVLTSALAQIGQYTQAINQLH